MIRYAKLASVYGLYDEDHSYTPPEMQLLWRLEDLEDRLQELTNQTTGCRDEGEYFSEDNLRYVLPKHFYSAANVRKAIDLAISDLKDRYGICISDQLAQEEPEVDEITDMQVTFFDILAMQPQCAPLNAA